MSEELPTIFPAHCHWFVKIKIFIFSNLICVVVFCKTSQVLSWAIYIFKSDKKSGWNPYIQFLNDELSGKQCLQIMSVKIVDISTLHKEWDKITQTLFSISQFICGLTNIHCGHSSCWCEDQLLSQPNSTSTWVGAWLNNV